jgi:hypothetical protein
MLDKFRAEIVDSSSDEEPGQSMQTMATVVASILHEYSSSQTPVHRSFVKGRSKNPPRNSGTGPANPTEYLNSLLIHTVFCEIKIYSS